MQRDCLAVARQPVKVRAIEAGEGLQLVERARLLKRVRVERQRDWRAENAGAAAGSLLLAPAPFFRGVSVAVIIQQRKCPNS